MIISLTEKYQKYEGDYNETVEINIGENLSNEKEVSIQFSNSKFRKGILIKSESNIEHNVKISFFGCFITSFKNKGDRNNFRKVELLFVNNVIKSLTLEDASFKGLLMQNCFGSFTFREINSISVKYILNNIFLDSWEQVKRLYKNIFSTPTKYSITNVENIYFDFPSHSKIGQTSKIKKERIPLPKINNRIKYTPSIEDIKSTSISISILYNNSNKGITTINNPYLKDLSLTGTTNHKINIENVVVNRIFIKEFSPLKSFHLMNAKGRFHNERSKFEIHKSNLNNTWFYGINFKSFDEKAFYKSSFIETKITSSVFGNLNDLKKIKAIKNVHYYSQIKENPREKYDLFLDLKNSLEKVSNTHEAMKMKSIALISLGSLYKRNILKKSYWNNRFILWLNHLSNNHGNSPINAFICFIIGTIIFHSLNIISFKTVYIDWTIENTWDIIKNNFRYITIIANPLHKISDLSPKGEVTSYTYFISFLSRIVIGYLYYQFITAFRRFGKK